MSKPVVYVQFPKAGLGNMMLTWSRGYVFSVLNNLEICTSSWTKIHLGAWIRKEKRNRLYYRYFIGNSIFQKVRFLYFKLTRKLVVEPKVEILEQIEGNTLYKFNKIFTDYDFFKEVRPHKGIIKTGIDNLLHPTLKKQFNEYPKPIIGVHIRRGDFKRGSTITPLVFFIDVINALRSETNEILPVTVFTDAEIWEIEDLMKLDNIYLSPPKHDILDILLLASSKIVVLSIGSTFSYWAAFLSEGKIIKHEKEWHVPFRDKTESNFKDEIMWENK